VNLSEAKSLKDYPDRLVWYSILDDKYVVTVTRPEDPCDDYKGTFEIFDAEGKQLHSEQVGLAYGARFGPDMMDVDDWQNKTIEFIDKGVCHDVKPKL
jgi:hypothetical protein